ncbi:MAG TPA: hypothetical protein VN081_05080 [Dongiaceae bacterium]|nr:hypothetical protein [Dongiaceae bacterium]
MSTRITKEAFGFGGQHQNASLSSGKDMNPETIQDANGVTVTTLTGQDTMMPTIDPEALGMNQYHNLDRFGYESFDQRPLTEANRQEVLEPMSPDSIQTDEMALRQLSEMVEGYTSLSMQLESMKGMSSHDNKVIRMMLRTGRSVLAQEAISIESYEGKPLTVSIALEGVLETLKGIWEAILRVVKRIWDKIMSFFTVKDLQSSYIDGRLDRLQSLINGVDGTIPTVNLISVGENYRQLGKGGGLPHGTRDIVNGLSEYMDIAKRVMTEYTGHLESVGAHLVSAAKGAKTDPVAWVNGMNLAGQKFVDGHRLYELLNTPRQINHPQYPGDTVHTSYNLIGGRCLLVVERPHRTENLAELTSSLTGTEVVLSYRHDYRPMGVSEITPYTLSDLHELLKLGRQLNALTKTHTETHVVERLVSIKNQLTDACSQMASTAPSHPEEVSRALQYVTAFSNWSLHPLAEMVASLQQVATHLVSFIGVNAAAYKGSR